MCKAYRNTKQIWSRIIVFLIVCTMLSACQKSDNKSPLNSYKSDKTAAADENSYLYYSAEAFETLVRESMVSNSKDIYSETYQKAAKEELIRLQQSRQFSIEYPLLIQNPFGTNQNGLYIYTGLPTVNINLRYKVSVEDTTIPDYTNSMYIDRTNTEAAEGQMIGLVPGYVNKVVIDITSADGARLSKKAYFLTVAQTSFAQVKQLNRTSYNKDAFTPGLFTILAKNQDKSYFLFYDNYGILRAAIPTYTKNESAKVLQAGNRIVYAYDDNLLLMVDNKGEVIQRYPWNEPSDLVDYDYDETNDVVLCLEKSREDASRQKIVELHLKSGEWINLIDFKKLLAQYSKQRGISAEDKTDWLDLSSIQSVDGNDLIVCSRELSTIFRINNIYHTPVIRWMLGEDTAWKDTDYESMLLVGSNKTPIGNNIDSVHHMDSKNLKDEECYVSFISYENLSGESCVYKLIVDENANKFRSVQTISFPYRQGGCSAMMYGSDVIISYSDEMRFAEYNQKGEIVVEFIVPDLDSSYQIRKYTMDRYWF